ncbi:MAG TPA: hypothetical protein ENJ08_02820 [Gammaproteobacteria bacterium]|nr:hypothetical protein [Gammaproteobacteria bacterium]
MNPEYTNNPLYSGWPFWVLELTPDAQNSDIEKAARDISSKIQFEIPDANKYATPEGIKTRDEFLIREARSKLQDPRARLLAEYWYINPLDQHSARHNDTPQSTHSSLADWYRELGITLWVE